MTRYHFHAFNYVHAIDGEGSEHPDLAAVQAYALTCARDMMSEDLRDGVLDLGHRIEVEDTNSNIVHVLYYRDAVRILNASDVRN